MKRKKSGKTLNGPFAIRTGPLGSNIGMGTGGGGVIFQTIVNHKINKNEKTNNNANAYSYGKCSLPK